MVASGFLERPVTTPRRIGFLSGACAAAPSAVTAVAACKRCRRLKNVCISVSVSLKAPWGSACAATANPTLKPSTDRGIIERTMRTMLLALLATAAATAQTTSGWKLVWSDEFNGPAGTLPNPANWNYDLGNNGGWGNGEAEVYTNSPNNVFQDGKGNLVIRAIRDSSGNFTSARLQTGSPGASTQTTDLSWQFGRVEARIKLPFGQGVWPAFWMLGEEHRNSGLAGLRRSRHHGEFRDLQQQSLHQ